MRIGIGHPGHKDLVLHWVLRDFEPDERDAKTGWLPKVLNALAEECGAAGRRRRQGRREIHEPGGASRAASQSSAQGWTSKSRSWVSTAESSGLPNVGKSTLFNALTATQAAQAANYPFCTIEPNVGRVAVPDPRLDKLAEHRGLGQDHQYRSSNSSTSPGLVKGASRGEGLGNQFLGNIREVDAIAHVLRCFEDGDVTHVLGQRRPGARCRNRRDRADARPTSTVSKSACPPWRSAPRVATRTPPRKRRS